MRALVVLLVLLTTVCVATPTPADELHIIQVFATGAFPCGAAHQDVWVPNPVGAAIRIKASTIWLGMSQGGRADFYAWVYTYNRERNHLKLLHVVGWDHYAEPTSHGGFRQQYAPDWVTLDPEEYLRLVTGCTNPTAGYGDVGVFLEYTVAPLR